MAWQSPPTGWTPDGPQMGAPGGPGMPMSMPMPMPITYQPGMGPPPGMAPPGVPMAPPPYPVPTAPPLHQGDLALPPGGWPAPSMSCPPGLEFLTTLDQLFVDQKVEVLEAFTGWETENRYVVKDIRGMPVYYVSEDSNVCSRCFCGKYRPCEIKVADNSRKEVLRFSRPLRCASCWCPCLLQELEVYSNGIPIGSVVQNWNPLRPSFDILDATGDTVLQIRGPICILCCDVNFEVKSRDGDRRVGRISKKWSGIGREFFTDSDLFGISFPGDLDVKVKAVLLGACILIDFMYFEGNKKAEL